MKQLRKQKLKRRRERKQQKHGKQKEGSNHTPEYVPVGTQNESPLTNEGLLDILEFLKIPTQQIPTALQEDPTSEFTPPNCKVVDLGLHEILRVSNRVIPAMFKGKRIAEEKVKGMMNDKKLRGGRQQINGSTFAKDQMPTITNDNKHWKSVVRPPDANELKQNNVPWATTINARVPGSTLTSTIMIHYLLGNVKDSFRKQSKMFLKNHTKVRVIVGESGSMVAAGSRVDFVTSSLTQFVGTTTKQLNDHSIDMHVIICSTICRTTLENTPCWSSEGENCP